MLIAASCLCGLSQVAAQSKPAPAQTVQPETTPKETAPNQTAPASPAAAKAPDVSKEALVFDKIYTRVREEADGTGTRETTARIRILADAGVKEMAVLTFTYTASNQQVDIAYVRVIKPDGTVVVTPDYNIQDMPADVTREAPMYSDIHQKHVAVKGLGVGDTLEYQITLRTLQPEVPGQFWLEYYLRERPDRPGRAAGSGPSRGQTRHRGQRGYSADRHHRRRPQALPLGAARISLGPIPMRRPNPLRTGSRRSR